METIRLRPELLEPLENEAKQRAKSVNDLVNEVVEQYLGAQGLSQLKQEIQVYEAMHSELKQKYYGEWVAFYKRQLADHDEDRAALYQRVRARYGEAIVLIRQVGEQPNEDIMMRTYSTGKVTL